MRTLAFLLAVLIPTATAYTVPCDMDRVHCDPCHAHHCDGFLHLLQGDAEATVSVTFANETSSAVPAVITGNASLLVALRAPVSNATAATNATVSVENTTGVVFVGPTNVTVELPGGGEARVEFPFVVPAGWPAPDRFFPRVAVGIDGAWAETWAPLTYAPLSTGGDDVAIEDPPRRTPALGWALALVAVSLAGVLVWRRR